MFPQELFMLTLSIDLRTFDLLIEPRNFALDNFYRTAIIWAKHTSRWISLTELCDTSNVVVNNHVWWQWHPIHWFRTNKCTKKAAAPHSPSFGSKLMYFFVALSIFDVLSVRWQDSELRTRMPGWFFDVETWRWKSTLQNCKILIPCSEPFIIKKEIKTLLSFSEAKFNPILETIFNPPVSL